jgi:MoxR-like ATPase
MQEHHVTVGRTSYRIEEPYFVLATQNPLEMEGTYPLPEAQLDRFFFKLEMPFPNREELHSIVDRTTTDHEVQVKSVLGREDILAMQKLVRSVPVARHVQDYAIRLLQATHPNSDIAPPKVRRYVRIGASPRGVQAILLASKARALFEGRFAAATDDIRASAPPALRHRILLSFEGEAEGISTDAVIREIIDQLPQAGV